MLICYLPKDTVRVSGVFLPAVHDPAFKTNALNVVRLILAVMVIHSHSWFLLPDLEGREIVSQLTDGELNCGGLAVNLFFALSGYLVSASWVRQNSLPGFLIRRALRIYPAFIVVCLWQAFLIVPLSLATTAAIPSLAELVRLIPAIVSLGGTGDFIAPTLKPFPNSIAPGEINGSLWTIRYEFLCYLALGFLGTVSALRHRWIRLPIFAGLLIGYAFWPDWDLAPFAADLLGPWKQWARLAVHFFAGVILYCEKGVLPANGVTVASASVLVCLSLAGPAFLQRLFGPLLLSWLLFHAAYRPESLRFNHYLRMDVSFGLYLYGFPVQQILLQFASHLKWSVWEFTIASVMLTLPFAVASWVLIERRFLRASMAH